MAKAKNKKRSVADSVRSKKTGVGEKVNPFEVKINRQKHKVVGQKLTKYDKGRPGVSRSKAVQKRKETLLVEYKRRGKTNTFVDKRIGENDPEMSVEDKMLQRFAAERQRNPTKSIFNLAEDEEELTHYGQSLSQIEKFDAPFASDDEDDDDDGRGKIGAKMVSEEFFGGGVLTKKDGDDKNKTWKERMEEIIANSKKRKFERQTEKNEVVQLTEIVDEEFKTLRQAMTASLKRTAKNTEDESKVEKQDDYDVMVRELQFEIKGTPSDRMKTDDEIAKIEKEKLEKLEADRIRRMKGLTQEEDAVRKRAFRSADSLDDDFNPEPVEQFELMYKDGKLVSGKGDQSESETGSGDELEDDENEEGGSVGERGEESGSDDEESGSDDSSGEDDVMKHLSDLESDAEEEEGDDVTPEVSSKRKLGVKDDTSSKGKDHATKSPKAGKTVQFDLKNKQQQMEEAQKELPYTFPAPSSYEELVSLLSQYSEMEQIVCLERLRKCHHPSLKEGNKEKLQLLFTFLVQYFCDLAVHKPSPLFWLMDKLVPHLYELSQPSPDTSAQAVLDLVLERQKEYCEVCARRNGKGVFPQLDVLMRFKLVSMLYPTSDLQHPVVTPTMLFMSQIITQSSIQTTRDVASGLLLCNLFLEYVSFSKRYVPEVINFLNGVLFLCYEKEANKIEPVIPPFKPVGKHIGLLILKEPRPESKMAETLRLVDIYAPSKAMKYLASDQFKLDATHLTVRLLYKFCDMYAKLPAHAEIFKSTTYFCSKLQISSYPQALKESITTLQTRVTEHSVMPRIFLKREKKKTQALKLFEPKIEEDFDPTRKKKVTAASKAKDEKQRLVAKHKKEMKGALREIRRDAQFLSKQRLQDQMDKDADRKRKVREIMGDLASQQGDINALKRKKNKS